MFRKCTFSIETYSTNAPATTENGAGGAGGSGFASRNIEIREGYFHQWGLDAMEDREGNISWTVAIVEDEKGKIHKVLPEKLSFVV